MKKHRLRLVEIELPVKFSPHFANTFSVSSKASGTHHQNRTKSNQKLPLEILSADGNGWRTKQQKIVV